MFKPTLAPATSPDGCGSVHFYNSNRNGIFSGFGSNAVFGWGFGSSSAADDGGPQLDLTWPSGISPIKDNNVKGNLYVSEATLIADQVPLTLSGLPAEPGKVYFVSPSNPQAMRKILFVLDNSAHKYLVNIRWCGDGAAGAVTSPTPIASGGCVLPSVFEAGTVQFGISPLNGVSSTRLVMNCVILLGTASSTNAWGMVDFGSGGTLPNVSTLPKVDIFITKAS